jgi:hypothetical protein
VRDTRRHCGRHHAACAAEVGACSAEEEGGGVDGCRHGGFECVLRRVSWFSLGETVVCKCYALLPSICAGFERYSGSPVHRPGGGCATPLLGPRAL